MCTMLQVLMQLPVTQMDAAKDGYAAPLPAV
jgi:hypothetical protein